MDRKPKPATPATRSANAALAARLPLDHRGDHELAKAGFVAPPKGPVLHELGFPIWDLDDFAFCTGPAPDSVNPSLWRHAQLNLYAGLFHVAERIWQVRGLDISNITFVAGETGWIVIDPLTTAETARAAIDLLHTHVEPRPVVAVIYTHSHVDHFGGVDGVVDEASVASGSVPIIAPEGFLHAAISENVFAGSAMLRRASYMYGPLLPRGPLGHVDAGLGKGVPALGTGGLIAPTDDIRQTGETRLIDGVEILFQLTPETEAPAEMNFFFPQFRALCMAENCSSNLHNLYTLRGAQVRDALAWSRYIDEAVRLFGDETDVVFLSHQWPRFGRLEAIEYMRDQRDVYRWLHDETLRLANQGLTMNEIAEDLELPTGLEHCFSARGYYGSVNHNAKAVYQRYLGWFDGNPAHLHPLPPVEAARRYVEFMGGADTVLGRARASFDEGDYRWVVEVVNHVVFADPGNEAARLLQADALEQLGYQAESGPWRGFYLTGAQELRHGVADLGEGSPLSPHIVRAMSVELLLDYIAIRLHGPRIGELAARLGLHVTDRDEHHEIELRNGTLHHHPVVEFTPDVEARLTLGHPALVELALGQNLLAPFVELGSVTIAGDHTLFETLFANLDVFRSWFPIVEP